MGGKEGGGRWEGKESGKGSGICLNEEKEGIYRLLGY